MIAVVTGGSRGIGRAIVETLIADGWSVAFTYRSDESAARALEGDGNARAYKLDLRDRETPGTIISDVEKTMGPIDALVNNAGDRRESLLASTPDRDWDELMDINTGGAFRFCREVLPKMMHRRRGSIVNVSSLSAIAGVAGQAAYAASKAALLGMTRSLAREVGKRGVRVNAIVPGFVITDMTKALPPETVSFLRVRECLPSGTSAADVAYLVSFLLSDRAAAITGQALVVDAGSSA